MHEFFREYSLRSVIGLVNRIFRVFRRAQRILLEETDKGDAFFIQYRAGIFWVYPFRTPHIFYERRFRKMLPADFLTQIGVKAEEIEQIFDLPNHEPIDLPKIFYLEGQQDVRT